MTPERFDQIEQMIAESDSLTSPIASELVEEVRALSRQLQDAERKDRDLCQKNGQLLMALHEIEKGAGPYSRDPLEHASNTIEAMKQLARDAVALQQKPDTCENYRDESGVHSRFCSAFDASSRAHAPTCQFFPTRKCPSTYTHSRLGKLDCTKDEANLHRIGDVEHRNGNTVWMSL